MFSRGKEQNRALTEKPFNPLIKWFNALLIRGMYNFGTFAENFSSLCFVGIMAVMNNASPIIGRVLNLWKSKAISYFLNKSSPKSPHGGNMGTMTISWLVRYSQLRVQRAAYYGILVQKEDQVIHTTLKKIIILFCPCLLTVTAKRIHLDNCMCSLGSGGLGRAHAEASRKWLWRSTPGEMIATSLI